MGKSCSRQEWQQMLSLIWKGLYITPKAIVSPQAIETPRKSSRLRARRNLSKSEIRKLILCCPTPSGILGFWTRKKWTCISTRRARACSWCQARNWTSGKVMPMSQDRLALAQESTRTALRTSWRIPITLTASTRAQKVRPYTTWPLAQNTLQITNPWTVSSNFFAINQN